MGSLGKSRPVIFAGTAGAMSRLPSGMRVYAKYGVVTMDGSPSLFEVPFLHRSV